MFCPVCGAKLLHIASSNLYEDWELTTSTNEWKPWEQWERNWLKTLDKSTTHYFVVCAKCKTFGVLYIKDGLHIKRFGKLTDEFIRVLIAAGLKENTS